MTAFEEKARAIAIDVRMDKGWRYSTIARDVFGGMVTASQVQGWCREFERSQQATAYAGGVEAAPNSTIMALFGGKGSGKSLTACGKALEYYSDGVPVYYNPRGLLRF